MSESQGKRGPSAGEEDLARVLHDRARESGLELRKTLAALATGALGVYFFSLTAEVTPPLTTRQVEILLVGVTLMAISSLTGLTSWYADSRRNYLYAIGLKAKGERRRSLVRREKRWKRYYVGLYWAQVVAFHDAGLCGLSGAPAKHGINRNIDLVLTKQPPHVL